MNSENATIATPTYACALKWRLNSMADKKMLNTCRNVMMIVNTNGPYVEITWKMKI